MRRGSLCGGWARGTARSGNIRGRIRDEASQAYFKF
jgi:hypothetical protein